MGKSRIGKSRASNTAQLRDDIDRGRTGDKVDWLDPAAAPLGTDDEAGGIPPAAGAVERARDAERAAGVRDQRGRRMGAAWVLIALVLLGGAMAIGWAILGSS